MTDNDSIGRPEPWLEDGPDLSDRAVRSTLDQIHVTRQRRSGDRRGGSHPCIPP